MKALLVAEREPALKIRVGEVPEPEIGPHDLLVKVVAAGLNWADLRAGAVRFGAGEDAGPTIPGLEMAGTVVTVGERAVGFEVGDPVMGMTTASLAEFARIDHRIAIKVPASVDWNLAGSSSVSLLTAHDALITHGKLDRGQSVFVHAATSGVGFAAIQMARMIDAGLIMGTASSPEKLKVAEDYGLDIAVNYRDQDFLEIVLDKTGGAGVDVVIDTVGAGVLDRNMRAVKIGGRIIGVGRFGGKFDRIDLDLLALRRISLIGVSFRTRSIEEHTAIVRRFSDDFLENMEKGQLTLPIAEVFGLNSAHRAFDMLASRDYVGKLILRF